MLKEHLFSSILDIAKRINHIHKILMVLSILLKYGILKILNELIILIIPPQYYTSTGLITIFSLSSYLSSS